MSLTRDQWASMWESIKLIESLNRCDGSPREKRIQKEVDYIKKQIQSVVGQME